MEPASSWLRALAAMRGGRLRDFSNPAQPCTRYGFVIFRDVLSDAECTRTRDEIWSYLEDSVQLCLKSPISTSPIEFLFYVVTCQAGLPACRANDVGCPLAHGHWPIL